MNCDCIKDSEAKVKNHVQINIKAPIDSVTCQNMSIIISPHLTPYMAINIPFVIKADAPGYRSRNGKILYVNASYCPFCGVDARPKVPND